MKKKIRLRPWVKIALVIIIGVSITSNIMSVFGANADTPSGTEVVHAVVVLNHNGESHVKVLESNVHIETISRTSDYQVRDIVSIVLEDGSVVNSYPTTGEELESVMGKYKLWIEDYRRSTFPPSK